MHRLTGQVLRDRKMTEYIASSCLVNGTLWGTFCIEGDEPEMKDIFEIKDAEVDPFGIATNKGYPTKSQKVWTLILCLLTI